MDELGKMGASEKWSNLAFCAERKIDIGRDKKKDSETKRARGINRKWSFC